MHQIECAAVLLRDGAGPVKHVGLIRITPKLGHSSRDDLDLSACPGKEAICNTFKYFLSRLSA